MPSLANIGTYFQAPSVEIVRHMSFYLILGMRCRECRVFGCGLQGEGQAREHKHSSGNERGKVMDKVISLGLVLEGYINCCLP